MTQRQNDTKTERKVYLKLLYLMLSGIIGKRKNRKTEERNEYSIYMYTQRRNRDKDRNRNKNRQFKYIKKYFLVFRQCCFHSWRSEVKGCRTLFPRGKMPTPSGANVIKLFTVVIYEFL
jgi:hypothetical protein